MTESEIDDIQFDVDAYNEQQLDKAKANFKKGPIPKMKWVLDRILDSLLRRIATVRGGDAPDAFGEYMSDELARVLGTKTFIEYGGLAIAKDEAASAPSGTHYTDVTYDCTIAEMTDEFNEWLKILAALGTYLREAAILAKAVNPSSTAARLYLRAWRLLTKIKHRGYATKDEALAVVRLERVAEDRLWVDVQFAALPPFRKAKKTKTGTAKGNSKA